MKWLIGSVLAFSLFGSAQAAPSTIFVGSSASPSVLVTATNGCGVGNVAFVALFSGSNLGTTYTNIVDSAGNTWTQTTQNSTGPNPNHTVGVFKSILTNPIVASTTTFASVQGGSGAASGSVVLIDCVGPAAILDGAFTANAVSAPGTSGGSLSVGTPTTTSGYSWVVVVANDNRSIAPSPPTGYTQLSANTPGFGMLSFYAPTTLGSAPAFSYTSILGPTYIIVGQLAGTNAGSSKRCTLLGVC